MLLLGVLLTFGSCVPLGYIFYSEFAVPPTEQLSVKQPLASQTMTVQTAPGTLARFNVSATITTPSVQEDDSGIEIDYIPRYKFPYSYRILDELGAVLTEDKSVIAWDKGVSSGSNKDISSTGGSLSIKESLAKIPVPASGRLTLEIQLQDDSTYLAKLSDIKINFYENAIDYTWYVAAGIAGFITGILASVVGFIFLLTGIASETAGTVTAGDVASTANDATAPEVRRKAMWIQLAGILWYVFPLANIIVPLALWLSWRNEDDYLNKMGREAVNFNISVTIYCFICILLMLVLIGFFLIVAVMIYQVTFVIIASVNASKGQAFRYPAILRLVK